MVFNFMRMSEATKVLSEHKAVAPQWILQALKCREERKMQGTQQRKMKGRGHRDSWKPRDAQGPRSHVNSFKEEAVNHQDR